uniref:eCIS core domain-containing protein n=1 Tax=Bradyrhizobium sp. (strain ORS 278) TaxID=114615 RepID=UPI0002EF8FC8|nr:DUF4157 domain-containing protein [Bradyrhizobium sp. ORS 278]
MSKRASLSVPASADRAARESNRVRQHGASRSHAEGAVGRGWSSPTPSLPPSRLRVGPADDVHEREAERAEQAVGATPLQSAAGLSPSPRRIQARAEQGATPHAPAGVDERIAAAAPEGRPLPPEQRTFYEQRLGHDFSTVRIHAGPAAAEAASSVRAQAFTHGQNIYFGQHHFQPNATAGQRLIAHELAHTVQQRPNVIARRALDGAGPSEMPPTTSPEQAKTPSSVDVQPSLTTADDSAPAAAAPRAETAVSSGQDASSDATMKSAARIQALVRTAEADAGQATAEAGKAPDEGEAEQTGQRKGAAESPASEAIMAAQAAQASFEAQLAKLAERRSAEIRFRDVEPGKVEDGERRALRQRSLTAANAFLKDVGTHVEAIITPARELTAPVLSELGASTAAITAATKSQSDVLHGSADASRQKVRAQTAQARGTIVRKQKDGDASTSKTVQASRDQASKAKDGANKAIDKHADAEAKSIRMSYLKAKPPMRRVGAEAGGNATDAAARKSAALLGQRNGESTLLDGPLHDDRLEAAAEAAVQVGDEYAKSFQKSADEQADKLSESKPEVLGKVTEIAGQAKRGLDDQLKQVNDGADAFAKSASARSAKLAADLGLAAGRSGKQTAEAIDAAEAQQAGELVAFSATQVKALDHSVATGLSEMADGVAQTTDGLIDSMGEFITSAATMNPPDPDELSSSLAEISGQTAASAGSMGGKIQTIGPALVQSIATGRDQSVHMAAQVGANAIKAIDGTRESFVKGAVALNQQTVTGYDKLGKADEKSAKDVGTQAETGFADAARTTGENFKAFGDKVEENFALGRAQMLASLWGSGSKAQLDADMDKYGKEAADKVQPRWKKVLKWAITIIVIIAVIAITVATAGALGPVGVVLLGAALGAAAGAVTTIANNLIDGKKWSDGVVKAMIVGAIGGAVGGAGGVILKGVGSIALKIGLEFAINVAGGVLAEAVGSLAVGETINWTSALMGALIGAGIGAGLGIAGALKGKIRLTPVGDIAPPPQVKPQVEVPPQPSGRVRGLLEQAKILAPRPGSVPEVAPGVAPKDIAGVEPKISAPDVSQPAPANGVEPGPSPTAAAEPPAVVPEPAALRTPAAAPDQVTPAASAEPAPGISRPEPAGPPSQPEPSLSPDSVKRPIAGGRQQLPAATGEPGAVATEPPASTAPDNVYDLDAARRARAAAMEKAARQAEPRIKPDVAAKPKPSGPPVQAEPRVAPSHEGVAAEAGTPDNLRPISSARRARAAAAAQSAPQAEPQRQQLPVAAGGEGRVVEPADLGGGPNTAADKGSALDIRASANPGGRAEGARSSRGGTAARSVGQGAELTSQPIRGGGSRSGRGASGAERVGPPAVEADATVRQSAPSKSVDPAKTADPNTGTPESQAAAPEPREPDLPKTASSKPETQTAVPSDAAPTAAKDPLVAVKIRGNNKGEYWSEGSSNFKKNAGSATRPPNKDYVVLPKSQADALGFQPKGTPFKSTIEPRMSGGKQIESSGAGRETHPITARTTRKPPGAGSSPDPLEMPNADPSAQHAFPRTIGADVAQAHGYNGLLDAGELGVLRPGNVSTGGVDSITATVEGGKAKIYLNDFTSPGTSKPAKPTHGDWAKTLDAAAKQGRLSFGDPDIEQAIQQAVKDGEVYVRTVEVSLPEVATPGSGPKNGIAAPSIKLGAPTKVTRP